MSKIKSATRLAVILWSMAWATVMVVRIIGNVIAIYVLVQVQLNEWELREARSASSQLTN